MRVNSKLNLSVCLLVSLAWGCSVAAQRTVRFTPKFDVLRNGIAHIGEGPVNAPQRWLGSGFLLDDSCTCVTAKHILTQTGAKEDQIIVRFQWPSNREKTQTTKARILFQSPDCDLAFLRLVVCDLPRLHVFPLVEASRVHDLTGAEVLIIGYPVLSKEYNPDIPILRTGVIASTELTWDHLPMLLLDLPGGSGFSGSPVILKDTGEVIGVVYGPGPTERIFAFEWATQITKDDYEKATAQK